MPTSSRFTTLVVAYNLTLYRAESGPIPEIVIRGGMLFAATSTLPVPNREIGLRDGRIVCMGAACDMSAEAIESVFTAWESQGELLPAEVTQLREYLAEL